MALTKMTVNLTRRSVNALAIAGEHTELSKADNVNRALQLLAWWVQMEAAGSKHMLMGPDGRTTDIITLS